MSVKDHRDRFHPVCRKDGAAHKHRRDDDIGIPTRRRVGEGFLESDEVGAVGDHHDRVVIIGHAQTPSTPCLESTSERKIGFGSS